MRQKASALSIPQLNTSQRDQRCHEPSRRFIVASDHEVMISAPEYLRGSMARDVRRKTLGKAALQRGYQS